MMKYKVYEGNGYNIHTIKTDKFKTCSMEIIFRKKIEKEQITISNFLIDMLMYSSKKYNSKREMAIALENLYSSSVRGVSSRLGNSVITSIVTDFLNPKYCYEGFLDDIISFPFELLYNPNVKDGEFDKTSFKIIKNMIESDIRSLKENASKYAFRRSLLNMDEDSVSSYSMIGYEEDLKRITPRSLYDFYKSFFKDYVCDIYIVGNLEMDHVVSLVKEKFSFQNKRLDFDLYVDNKVGKEVKDIKETGRYEQDSFVMIYNVDDLTKRERDFVIRLYNIILGSGGLTSKLYKYLREENSLCYTVSSMYQKYDKLLMIYAGIDKKDKELCESLVNKAMVEMQEGIFKTEDLENAKKTIISSIRMNEDSIGGIINNYLFKKLDGLPLFSERIKCFESVTKEEIISLAKKIKLNTVYLLAGEESNGRD